MGSMSQKSAHRACGSWTRALHWVEVAVKKYVAPPMHTVMTAAWTSCCSATVFARVRAAAAARHWLASLLESSPAFTLNILEASRAGTERGSRYKERTWISSYKVVYRLFRKPAMAVLVSSSKVLDNTM
jgi:hypothetical protein